MSLPPLPPDTHEAQARRVADHCARHPGQFFTLAELAAACDLGSPSKVLSAMARDLGYRIDKACRRLVVAHGTRARTVTTYRVTHRPAPTQLPLNLQ